MGCNNDDPLSDYYSSVSQSGNNVVSGSTGSSMTSGDLLTFDIAVDKETGEPSTTADATYPEAEDNLDDSSNSGDFTTEVAINVSSITDGTYNGVTVTHDGNNIVCDHGSSNVCYVLSGTTDNGSVTIMGEKKCEVKLNSVSINSPDSAALNVLCKKRCFLYLVSGTTNSLTDNSTGSGENHKGALYCKGKLLVYGSGVLNVYGNYNNAIHSADYIIFNKGVNVYARSTANHGIKANDGIYINGGIINVEVSAAASKGINCESDIIVNGGRTTAITTGGGTYDTTDMEAKGCAGIKSDTNLTINGGVVNLKSTGAGGKGISTDALCTVNGGEIYIVTTGSQYKSNNDTSSPKGIKADGNITINGGRTWVRTSGTGGEGIESKATLTINGGEVASYAYDDAINSKSTLTINDGSVFALGQNSDGIDANGNCYVKGGFVYASCAGSPEVAIDANTEDGYKLYVEGGTIVAIGGLENGSSLSQACYQASWSANTWYALTYNNSVFAFQTPSRGGTGLVVSAPSTPTLLSGSTISGGTSYFGGLGNIGGTVSGGSSVTLSSYSGGSGMGGQPGGGPGRW